MLLLLVPLLVCIEQQELCRRCCSHADTKGTCSHADFVVCSPTIEARALMSVSRSDPGAQVWCCVQGKRPEMLKLQQSANVYEMRGC